MGFFSTFVTHDFGVNWPSWFVEKYRDTIHFNGSKGPIAAKASQKEYRRWPDLVEDIQKAIDWSSYGLGNFILVYLHECGGITRVQIEKDRIVYTEPTGWEVEDGVMHEYCSGCSDAPESGAA